MKKALILLLLFVFGLTLPIGCSSVDRNNKDKEQVLNIYNWTDYLAPDAIAQFEKQYSAKINYDVFDNNEALYSKLKAGNPGYDVVFPSDYMVAILIADGLLEKLNKDKLPNLANIEKKFLDPPFDPGNQYSIPYHWGTMGIGYNIKATGGEIDSWGAMFDPKYKGRVAWLDDMRPTLAAALIYLGYDPNTTQPEEIVKAKDLLVKHKDMVVAFGPGTCRDLLNQGEADLASDWNGDTAKVAAENPNLRYVAPKEGTILWADALVIPKGAPHRELAEKFLNFMLEPETAAKNADYAKFATANKIALTKGLVDKNNLKNPAIYPPLDSLKNLQYIKDVGEATKFYDQAWTEFKAAIGK
ncbi:ABC transporter substrate-binding protein [Hydrococcus rivularis NIES-593]|uniref:ABC transporter substrate-binding protein n=1 Tax=Hydrococcus rivularis NIES-593 TaxID=1921803 RepID=A0A1U7H8G6_9CYAN|nr:spermidine/putrescine ABC transporter substrate-binding protein [Hydrococcus rivularis]OKH19476.1 ABC transporter substrate-binding protein [Hydrococcus rivularis NIES-593]